MHDWLAVASGGVAATWVKLGMVPTKRVPLWAAHWLVDSYDREALRTLAGYSGRDPYEVRDVLPDALADCGTPIPDPDSAAAEIAFTKLARMYADGTADEKWIMDEVDETVSRSGYAHTVIRLPLGQLYTLADEWEGGWGRTEQGLKAELQQACTAQRVAHSSFAPPLLRQPVRTRLRAIEQSAEVPRIHWHAGLAQPQGCHPTRR